MVKVTAVSYLNTIPFIYGLKQSKLIDTISLELDYPSVCADKLINGKVDLALAPVITISDLEQSYMGVRFLAPVDQYRMAFRSVKYDVLFLTLVFMISLNLSTGIDAISLSDNCKPICC